MKKNILSCLNLDSGTVHVSTTVCLHSLQMYLLQLLECVGNTDYCINLQVCVSLAMFVYLVELHGSDVAVF